MTASTSADGAGSRGQLRILIVEDHALFAESLELVLSVEGYDVHRVPVPTDAGAPGSLAALATAIARSRPRIVLLDLDLGHFGDGIRLIAPLAKAAMHVVVVTASADEARWGEALRHGARGVLPKSRPLQDILAIVRRINQGLPVMDRAERERLLRIYHEQRHEVAELRERVDLLTAREADVLGYLMDGLTVHQIAEAEVLTEGTVRTHVKAILAKLQVGSQIAAVGLAHKAGWRPPPGRSAS